MPALELIAQSARAIYQVGSFTADEQQSAPQRAIDIQLSNESAETTRVYFESSRGYHHLQVNLRIIPKISDHDSEVIGFMKIFAGVWPNRKVTFDTIAELQEGHFNYVFNCLISGAKFHRVVIHSPRIIERRSTPGAIFDNAHEDSFILDGIRFLF